MKNWCGYSKKELKIIRDFIHEINEDIGVRISTGKNWKCIIPWYRLYLGAKKQPQWIEDLRIKWCSQQEFYDSQVNMNIISLLHEIGHFQTLDLEEWLERNEIEQEIEEEYANSETMTMEELNFKYFDIPNEYKATKWAFEYYKANKSKCENLAKLIKV